MSWLYSDDDPEYRATKIHSGIPPPGASMLLRTGKPSREQPPLLPAKRHSEPNPNFNLPQESSFKFRKTENHPRNRHPTDSPSSSPTLRKNPDPEPILIHQLLNPPIFSFRYHQEETGTFSLEYLASIFKPKTSSLKDLTIESILFPTPLHDRIVRLKARMNKAPEPELIAAKEKVNPFTFLKNATKSKYDSVYFASLDSQLQITPKLLKATEPLTITELCLQKPSGLSDYLRLCLESDDSVTLDFRFKNLNKNQTLLPSENPCSLLNILADKQDLVVACDFWENELSKYNPESHSLNNTKFVDLVVANLSPIDPPDETLNEINIYKNMLKTLVYAASTLKANGDMILLVAGNNTRFSAQIIYIFAVIFSEIKIQKPPTGDQAIYERFIVCENLLLTHDTRSQLLDHMLTSIPKDYFDNNDTALDILEYDHIFQDTRFVKFLHSVNLSIGLKNQKYLEDILKFLDQRNKPSSYNHQEIADACKKSWKFC